tara:strand:+ start:132 stop:326 length:195 start_codon:yes stop_codon:yes gene_type:complete
MNLQEKINILEKLKEEQNTKEQKLRFGVKPRWNGNPTSFFRNLKTSLQSNSKDRLENLKRSMST